MEKCGVIACCRLKITHFCTLGVSGIIFCIIFSIFMLIKSFFECSLSVMYTELDNTDKDFFLFFQKRSQLNTEQYRTAKQYCTALKGVSPASMILC